LVKEIVDIMLMKGTSRPMHLLTFIKH